MDAATQDLLRLLKGKNDTSYRSAEGFRPEENNGYVGGWDWDTIRWGYQEPAPDRFDESEKDQRFGSSHQAGVLFVYADGSVRLVRFGISLDVFRRGCSRNDGEPGNPSDL